MIRGVNGFQQVPPSGPPPGPPMGKVEEAIRDSVDFVAGWTGAGVGTVVHAPMGMIEGLRRGAGGDKGGFGTYVCLHSFSTIALGAGVGAVVGGPMGAFAGAAGGFVENLGVLAVTPEPPPWMVKVDQAIDEQLQKPHSGSPIKIAVQKAIEGSLIGTGVGIREGAEVGRQVGQGVGAAVVDVGKGVLHAVEGVAQGIWQVITER